MTLSSYISSFFITPRRPRPVVRPLVVRPPREPRQSPVEPIPTIDDTLVTNIPVNIDNGTLITSIPVVSVPVLFKLLNVQDVLF